MSEKLTLREMQCVRLAGEGLSDKQIRLQLGMQSHRTVQSHLSSAYRKLGVEDRFSAAAALRRSYVELPIPISEPLEAEPFEGVSGGQTPISDETPQPWPLPDPPAAKWRWIWILVFASVGALITVGIVAVIAGASDLWSTSAPPNAIRSLD